MTKLEELIAKLSELFELDKADLDFGIHRIIKSKHTQVRDYLEKRLPQRVQEELGKLAAEETASQLEGLRDKVTKDFGEDAINGVGEIKAEYASTPLGKKYEAARESSAGAETSAKVENEVYSHLLEFFSRYYEDLDFMSLRRRTAGRESYSIPYNGEEVVLHWANKDQYYIKSSEDLKNYAFMVPLDTSDQDNKGRVTFKLTRMDAVQNNNKATRVFQLDEKKEVSCTEDELVIPFYFTEGKKRKKAEEEAWELSILKAVPEGWQTRLSRVDQTYTGKGERSILQKHLRNYTKKNTTDYFIHKDLGGFLRRELDFYVKNEVMYLDDIDNRPTDYLDSELRKIKAIRAVAHDLINFLAQFENFQKKLWLKKKFVIETGWCISLDRIPETFYPEIAANNSQREEWVKLFAVDEIDDLHTPRYSIPLTVEFLQANKNLTLDTKCFDDEFVSRLLATLDDIEGANLGLLVNSDNFQALTLLAPAFRGQVRATYIDPPYNTVHSEIIYKNQYKHSSWLSLMANTTSVAPKFWDDPFSFGIAIDDYEFVNLTSMLDGVFPNLERSVVVVNHHPQGAGGRLSRTHEYFVLLSKPDAPAYLGEPREDNEEKRSFTRSGTAENNYRHGRWKSFYAILYDEESELIVDAEEPVPIGHAYPTEDTTDGFRRIYPINSRGEERVWRSSFETGKQRAQNGELSVSAGGTVYQTINHEGKRGTLFSNWTDSIFNAGIHGSNALNDLGLGDEFDYPKSINTVEKAIWAQTYGDLTSIVMDYFAGSGTTGHAVVNINRKYHGRLRCILVEMGDYFNKVTKPRFLKAIYAAGWKDGKPLTRDSGSSYMFKTVQLETYEDALNNLALEDHSSDLLGQSQELQDEYLLRYCLDVETEASLLDCERFKDPFNYQLKIFDRETSRAKPTKVDLSETFNYMLGLKVRTMQMMEGTLVIEGENPAAETVLVIWRNVAEMDNEKLDAFVSETLRINTADTEYAAIYINGDTTLDDPHKKIRLTEQVFHDLMFDTKED